MIGKRLRQMNFLARRAIGFEYIKQTAHIEFIDHYGFMVGVYCITMSYAEVFAV